MKRLILVYSVLALVIFSMQAVIFRAAGPFMATRAANGAVTSASAAPANTDESAAAVDDAACADADILWPVPNPQCYIAAAFSAKPGKVHNGIDICVYGGSWGNNIVAALDGEVLIAGPRGGYGNCVLLRHANGLFTLYAHCASLAAAKGQVVKQGDVIATIGVTGNALGPHLHFEVLVKNAESFKRLNPLDYVNIP